MRRKVSHVAFGRSNAVQAGKIERLRTLFGEMELPGPRRRTPARRLPCYLACRFHFADEAERAVRQRNLPMPASVFGVLNIPS